MSGMGDWIEFVYYRDSPSGKTKIWWVMTKGDNVIKLGVIKYYSHWRKYSFFPEPRTVFEQDCLRNIAQFCEYQTTSHKKAISWAVKRYKS